MDARTDFTHETGSGSGLNIPMNECESTLWDFMGTSTYQTFEGISSYYSFERNYESDVQAAYLAYKDALDKARYWINFFKNNLKDEPFAGVIKTRYIGPAITGRSKETDNGRHKFWVRQKIRVSVAELSRKIIYDKDDVTHHLSLQTELPNGPDPYPDPSEIHHKETFGSVPNSIYFIFGGLKNNGKPVMEKVFELTEKLMRYEVVDETIHEFMTFHNACEEYEFFTFSEEHAGVRLSIPDIYQMYEDLKTTEIHELHFHPM